MAKYKNKYRIELARLQNWDYGSNGMYFITICTQDRVHNFGENINGKMYLSEIGKMAEKYWFEIRNHFPFLKLDAFVVMATQNLPPCHQKPSIIHSYFQLYHQ